MLTVFEIVAQIFLKKRDKTSAAKGFFCHANVLKTRRKDSISNSHKVIVYFQQLEHLLGRFKSVNNAVLHINKRFKQMNRSPFMPQSKHNDKANCNCIYQLQLYISHCDFIFYFLFSHLSYDYFSINFFYEAETAFSV